MKWTVEGADSQTGQERTLTVEAATREQAEQLATYNGVLVSSVSEIPLAPVLPYSEPSTPPVPAPLAEIEADPHDPFSAVPDYPDLLASARTLSLLASIVRVLALLSFAAAAILFGISASNTGLPRSAGAFFTLLLIPLAPAAWGLALLILAAVLAFLASLSRAARDVARNSFRTEERRSP